MTLGQLLKSKRNELGRSLEQISAATKIHAKILQALEEDQYSDLPARAFTRGFIVTYSKALKLDSEQVLKDYHDFLESKFAERQDRDQGHQGYVFEGKELEQNKRWVVIGTTIAILFMIAVLVIFKPQNHHRKEKHKEFAEETQAPGDDDGVADVDVNGSPVQSHAATLPSSSPVQNSSALPEATSALSPVPAAANSSSATPAASASVVASVAPVAVATATPAATAKPSATVAATPAATATPATSPTASPSPTPKADKLNKGDDLTPKDVKRRILFQASDDVWVRYQADDKPAMLIVLRKGRQLVIKAKDHIRVETNNTSALEYKTKGSQYIRLEQGQFTVEGDGSLKTGESISPEALPSAIPSPATP